MLASEEIIRVVAVALKTFGIPCVVDPVPPNSRNLLIEGDDFDFWLAFDTLIGSEGVFNGIVTVYDSFDAESTRGTASR